MNQVAVKGETVQKSKDFDPCNDPGLFELDDNQVIRVTRERNQECYHEIIRRYEGRLTAYLRHLVGSHPEEVQDVLQDVFVKVYKNIDSYDVSKKFSSWIYRIAHNEAVNHLKKKGRSQSVSWEDIVRPKDQLTISEENEENVQTRWLRQERRDEVNEALGRLPQKYREVLVLRYQCGHSYQAISDILGKPQNTVGTLIRRAKEQLLHLMNEEQEFCEDC